MIRYIFALLLIATPAFAQAEGGFRGALVWKSADQIIQPGVPGIAPITFDAVVYDTCGCWNQATGRFVVPEGASFVRLKAQAVFQYVPERTTSNDSVRQIVIKKNFTTLSDWYSGRPGWAVGHVATHRATTVDVNATGPVLPVVPGDNFLVDAFVWDGAGSDTVTIKGTNGTWFAIEIVQ